MQFDSLPAISVIKKEEKEAKLKAFITEHFARSVASPANADRVFLLVARSHESPVVRALAGALAEAGNQDFALKAIVLMPGASNAKAWPCELASADCRVVSDLRLLDAHEQLWLDSETAWIGDCMRREPSKRDAYECYADACMATAHSVETAFARLWEKGQPLETESVEQPAAMAATIDPHLASLVPGEGAAPTASTRH